MDDLISLVKLLSKQKVKQIDIISEDAKFSPKSKLLYEGILNDGIKTDEEACLLLYGDVKNNSSYRKLRGRFENKLINTPFFYRLPAKPF